MTRKKERFDYKTSAYFTIDPNGSHDQRALITDLTDEGACIKTKTIYKKGTLLYMTVQIGESSFGAEGKVAWAAPHKGSSGLVPILKHLMGVRFTKVHPGLAKFYKEKVKGKAKPTPLSEGALEEGY
jgi:Tfp pilus assembly protein PilZ